jgi:hypothetical protein
MKNIGIIFNIFICFAFLQLAEAANQSRRLEEDARSKLEDTQYRDSAQARRLLLDYGGWMNFRYTDYKDDDNNSSIDDEVNYRFWWDSRFWFKLLLNPMNDPDSSPQHSLYVRVKNLYSIGKPDQTAGGCDNEGPSLDYAYLNLDFYPAQIKLGRSYFTIGQGIAYADVGDGVEFLFEVEKLKFKTLLAQSLPHQDNIDSSVPGYDKHARRVFVGLEGTYQGISGHDLYAFMLLQHDKSKEEPEDPYQDYAYDSEYYGVGLRGKISPAVSYWWEIIGQTGKSYTYDSNQKSDISAWANIAALEYRPEVYSHPSVYLKYAYGSGDEDRASPTDTINGNTSGKDKGFLYFGYLPTGFVLSPQLSNLQFFKGGILLNPLEKSQLFKNLSFGFDFYKFYKAQRSAGIDDDEAAGDSYDIGQELDLSVNWQVFSDLSFLFEYGHFWPGKAYIDSANDPSSYISISTTLTF